MSNSCDPMDCSPPGSSVHGISQARILEWVAISFFRGSSWPRDQTHVSCIGRWVLYCWASKEARQRSVTLAKHDVQHTQFVRLSLNCQKVKSAWKGESRKFYLEDIVNGLYSLLWPGLHCFRWSLTLSGLRSSPFTLGTAQWIQPGKLSKCYNENPRRNKSCMEIPWEYHRYKDRYNEAMNGMLRAAVWEQALVHL